MKHKIILVQRSGIRQFAKNYRIPVSSTVIFLLLILTLVLLRARDRALVASILSTKSSISASYADLLSRDKTDDLKKNNVGEDQQTTPAKASATTTQTAFTISPDGGTATPPDGGGTTPPDGGGGSTPPPTEPPTEIFSANIDELRYMGSSALMECSSQMPPPPTGGDVIPRCKKYYFKTTIRAKDGSGTVAYTWHSNVPRAVSSGDFYTDAIAADTFTTITKQVEMACWEPVGTFHIGIELTQPNSDNRGLAFNHSCTT